MSETHRLRPLQPDEWTDEVRRALLPTIPAVAAMEPHGEGRPARDRPLNILLVLAHNERLLAPFLQWAATLAVDGALHRRDAELLALRAAWNCRSPFEWGHHVDYARMAGLGEAEIARIPAGADADGWSPSQAALLRAADALHESSHIPEPTWTVLCEHFDEAQLVELVMTVGQYTMLSMVANALGVEAEPGIEPLPGDLS